MKSLDSEEELKKMAEYYAKDYEEVYFVIDLSVNFVIAVECYPAKNGPTVVRNGRRLNCFNYKSRLLASRERLDKTTSGKPMVGYESISGNDTRLGAAEKGVVDEQPLTPQAAAGAEYGLSSPFEQFQKELQIASAQAVTGIADYEFKIKDDGLSYERFETFAVERVR